MNPISRAAGLPVLAASVLLLSPDGASAQCDPDAGWRIYAPTGDVAEILTVGEIGWVAAVGGVLRIDLSGVAGGNPAQFKITDNEGLVSNDVSCMTRDGFGNIWIGTRESGVSVFNASGGHVANLNSFEELWSDKVISMSGLGDRVIVTSADDFTPQGSPEGGGFVSITVQPDGGGGFDFVPSGSFPPLEVGQETLLEDTAIWFGTSGDGLWLRDESVAPATFARVLNRDEGLPSDNLRKIVRAPAFGQTGEVLWLGTSGGLATWNPNTGVVDSVLVFQGHNILDLWRSTDSDTMYVLSENGSVRDLFTVDLTVAPAAARIPRASCLPDTNYVPREVAVDPAGRVVLGTRQLSFAVREGLQWYCPPPLGPHAPQVADLVLAPTGTLYFGTGDKQRDLTKWNGIGVFDSANWSSITADDGILHPNCTEVLVWHDGTVWFGTTISRDIGGVNRYYPETGLILAYHDDVPVGTGRQTLGRNCYSLSTDAQGNLWIVYGQIQGGLSVIDAQTEQITNYDIGTIFSGTDLLRDLAIDSRGRLWICTQSTTQNPPELYVIDTRGTIHDLSDDVTKQYSMASQVAELLTCHSMAIDSQDQVLIAGDLGIARGFIPSGSLPDELPWEYTPSSSQTGGRIPQPYRVVELDWDENFWLGTESSGLVRVSNDFTTWDWYDQLEGCPTPGQTIAGLYMDDPAKTVWVGTALGGIARINLSASGGNGNGGDEDSGDDDDPKPSPNPWNPDDVSQLELKGIPPEAAVTIRVWATSGELVYEKSYSIGSQKTWDGTNTSGTLVESGVYLITAEQTAPSRFLWEGKVAVIR